MEQSYKLTEEDVLKIARLVHIEVSESEAETLRADLSAIFTFVHKLEELSVEGVSPTSHIGGIPAALRKDEVRIEGEKDKIRVGKMIKQFPSRKDGYLQVPHVFRREA